MTVPDLSGHSGKAEGATVFARYYSPELDREIVCVPLGGCYVTDDPGEVLTTVLGSCVSACIRDTALGVGGLNHFLLPDSVSDDGAGADDRTDPGNRYGAYAMEALINGIMRRGGRREYLEVKLFGGAEVLRDVSPIGRRNVEFAEAFCQNEGIAVAARHLGGKRARRIQYFPGSGRVRLRLLPGDAQREVVAEEQAFNRHLRGSDVEGDVELFND
jgi:chemotaxis protein CheD